jgi:hypothetical protein
MSKAAIILAAGQGTRMKSALPKVPHKVAGPGSIFPAGIFVPDGKMRPKNKMQARHV